MNPARFVVVRDPAERLVSAFLNKCVTDGYMRYVDMGYILLSARKGASIPAARPFLDTPNF